MELMIGDPEEVSTTIKYLTCHVFNCLLWNVLGTILMIILVLNTIFLNLMTKIEF